MALRLHNSLSGTIEDFASIAAGEARIYHCGPTVYDFVHIGNLRAYIFADTLRRALEYAGFAVKQVVNITDIGHLSGENQGDADEGDDKMMKGLRRENLPVSHEGLKMLADKYEEAFREDLSALNVKTDGTQFPRATRYVAEDIELVKKLEEKGLAYRTGDGIYFDTGAFPAYGKLGQLTPLGEEQDRVSASGKKSPRDFALWKFSKDDHLGFESPWGPGFPGWHIECSAMSRELLGQPFDIHTGGIDHIPVHHNNEIAQSEAAYGVPLANYWMHGAFLNVKGAKMAKSDGGFVTLRDLQKRGFSPLAYRYLILSAHYRSPVNFTDESLEAASAGFIRLIQRLLALPKGGSVNAQYQARFRELVENDLDTPRAIALMWELLIDPSMNDADRRSTVLEFDKIFGLKLEEIDRLQRAAAEENSLPDEIKEMAERRAKARQESDFALSDKLREDMQKAGYVVEDGPEGQKIRRATTLPS